MSGSTGRSPRDVEPAEFELGLPGEDHDRLAVAESDAAFRWAAAAAAGRDALVVGCGDGHGADMLLEAGARSVVGADPSPRAIEVATRLYGERLAFVEAEPTALPLAAGSFEIAVCIDAPRATLEPAAVIAELRRVLSDGGVLLATLPLSASPLETGRPRGGQPLDDLLESSFANVRRFRRRVSIAASIAPMDDAETVSALERTTWLTGGAGEDRTLLAAASDGELPELPSLASMVSLRDLRAQQETLAAWEERARRAEADGSAKHWELVAAREAQRRLRMRLHAIEHRPLRVISRVLRGKPARLGPGPPIRASEHKPQRWD